MISKASLISEYRRLLKEHGYRAPSLEDWTVEYLKLLGGWSEWTRREGLVKERAGARTLKIPDGIFDDTPPANAILPPLIETIEDAAAEWQMSLPMPVHCGVFPTGRFNAVARRVEDGALLLINEGLLQFLYQCCEVWVLSVDLSHYLGEREPKSSLGALISKEQAIESLAEIVYAYLRHGWSKHADKYPMIGGFRGALISKLSDGVNMFVLAHEYGHVYGRHLLASDTASAPSLGGASDLIPKTWEQEYKADILAMRLLVPPSLRKDGAPDREARSAFRLAAPCLFFGLDVMLTITVAVLTESSPFLDTKSHDHPPSPARMEHLRRWAKMTGACTYMGIGDAIWSWIEEVQVDVATRVCKRIVSEQQRR